MPKEPRPEVLHPLIQFRVKGYVNDSSVQRGELKPPTADGETRRKFHIGVLYPHVPIADGLLYEIEIAQPGAAHLPDIYTQAFGSSVYSDHLSYNWHIQKNCPLCNPHRKQEMIDERKAPGA